MILPEHAMKVLTFLNIFHFKVLCPFCTNLHHVLVDLLGVSVDQIDLFRVAVLHNLHLGGVVLVLVLHGRGGRSRSSLTQRTRLCGHCRQQPRFTHALQQDCDTPADMPRDSCRRRPGKNGGLTPTLHTHTHPERSVHSQTCTQCNDHRQKRNA